jgi:Skp family chaperone for outer membrane proteins
MAGMLDIFSIAFQSDGLKDFEQELKKNEAELAKYEKKVADTEKAMQKLADSGKKDSVEYKRLEATLEEAKGKVALFSKTVSSLKGRPQASISELKNNFASLVKTVAKMAVVGIAIKKALNFVEQGQQLDWLAQKAGATSDKLQAIGGAAGAYGGTTEGTAGTLENLRNQYQSLRMGEGGGGLEQAAFKYGVELSSDPEKMLENVAKRMETLQSDAAKWDLANTLGIDEGTARLLMTGLDGYTEAVKKASKYKLYTKDDINRMREYKQISTDIRMGVESLFGSIYRSLLPAITEVAKVIRNVMDWMTTHSGAVKIMATIAAVTAGIMTVIEVISLLNKAMLFLGANPIVIKIMLIVAAITALIVIIQDLYAWFQGGDSVIGSFLESSWELIKEFSQEFVNVFADFFEWLFEKWDELVDLVKSIGSVLTDVFSAVGDGIKNFFLGIWNWIKKKIASLVDLMPDFVKNFLGFGDEQEKKKEEPSGSFNTASLLQNGQAALSYANASPLNAMPSGAITNYYSTQSQNKTSIDNTRTLTNSKSNSVVIQNMTVETQADNAEQFYNGLQTLTSFDNGLR